VTTSTGSLLVKAGTSLITGSPEEYLLLKQLRFTSITPPLFFHKQQIRLPKT